MSISRRHNPSLMPAGAARPHFLHPRRPILAMVLGLSFLFSIRVFAQSVTPVYVDDSVAGRETLAKIPELLASGNITQAARNLQNILDTESDRMLEADNDPDFFRSVRYHVHKLLLSNPQLLERYRTNENDVAVGALAAGDFETVEHTRLLTAAGLDAAVRLAQVHLECGRFEAARLTLAQLATHPDRKPGSSAAKNVAAAAINIARYIDRDEVRSWAAALARDAGLPDPAPAELAAVPRPARASLVSISPTSQAGPIADDLGGVDPLASVLLGSQFERSRDLADEQLRVLERDPEIPDRAIAWTFATVLGDTVFVNDGIEFTAFDRYTLSQRWRTRPPELIVDENSDDRRGRLYRSDVGATLEDVSCLSVGSGVVVGASGLANNGTRRGDPRVHAFDAQTGAWLWSIDPASIDANLEATTVRGEILIEGDTAVVPLRKQAGTRRISSAYLLGLDLNSGRPRWLRLLATAGSLPSPQRGHLADSPLLDKGLLYQTDSVGIAACVEAQTGRPVWSRRFRTESNLRGGVATETSPVFNVSRPILEGKRLIAIQPSGELLISLDIETGDITARRALSTLGDPRVVFRVGSFIVAPTSTFDRFTIVPIENFETAPITATNNFGSIAIRGRASVSNGRLVVPTLDGLSVVDPLDPQNPKLIPLHAVGNTVIAPGQLIVTDARKIHSYVTFDTAQTLLRERSAKNPQDPEPSNDLIRLAFRAGKWTMIAPAADSAVAIFDADPTSPQSKLGRSKLFDLLLEACRSGFEELGVQRVRPAMPSDSAAQIVDRLAQCVATPQQHVEQLLMLARVREFAASPGAAVEAYEQILTDDSLAATVRFPGTIDEITAENEATSRLRQLLMRTGSASYRAFDDEARRAADAVTDNVADLERVARHYPTAQSTPDTWARASALHARAGRQDAATHDLARAVDAAAFGAATGRPEHALLHVAFALDLAAQLNTGGNPASAARVLAAIKSPSPEHAQRLSVLQTQTNVGIKSLQRLPRTGLPTQTRPTLLVGWSAHPDPSVHTESPLLPGAKGKSPEHVVMFNDTDAKFALFGVRPDGSFASIWDHAYEGGARPSLIRLDSAEAVLFQPSNGGGVVQSLDTIDGKSIWKTPEFSQWFEGMPERRRATTPEGISAQIATALDGYQRAMDLFVIADEKTLVLAQRSGRLGAVSLADGKRLWAANTKLDAIYDCAICGNVVVISGGVEPPNRTNGETLTPALVLLDTQTGIEIRDLRGASGWFGGRLKGAVRWVWPGADNSAIFGLEDGIMHVSLREGRVDWMSDDEALTQSAYAYVLPGDIMVLIDKDRALHLINSKTGAVRPEVLDTRGKVGDNSRLKVERIGDQISITNEHGVLLFDLTGKLVGMDGLGSEFDVLPPQTGQNAIFTLGRDRQELLESVHDAFEVREAAPLYTIDRKSGKLLASRWIVLYEDATSINLLDGKIIISAGQLSLVLDAPLESP